MLGGAAPLSEAVVAVTIPPDLSPTADELHAEVYRLVDLVVTAVRHRGGKVPGVGTPGWWRARDEVKVAALLILSEAWLSRDPDRAVRQRLREMSHDLAGPPRGWWRDRSNDPDDATLKTRRAKPGPLAREVDRAAAARWAATGGSAGSEGAA